jgi:hypothetical protein
MARVQQKSTRREPQVWPINRPSLRNGFNGFLRALPGDEFLFVTVAARINGSSRPGWADRASARLDTSNGCQDHTTSPSVTMPLVWRAF